MVVLLYLAIGLVIGTASGMLGIGGGVLLVPALLWIVEQSEHRQQKAAGITLAILSVPVTLPGVWQYFRQGYITLDDLKVAAWIAGAFAVGTYLGGWVQHLLVQQFGSVTFLRLLFGLLLLYVALRFIVRS